MRRFLQRSAMFFVIVLFSTVTTCYAYSLLTHLAVVDAAWDVAIFPALKQKFPYATEEQLKQARAFAYGGSVTPDIGYGRHGNKFFSDLIHYVRTGDFVENILLEAQDLNEYAFALGVLTHYYADEYGHSIGVNLSVPLMFPEMKKKFGNMITYADDALTHSRVEFSFDVIQTERGNYASKAYHDFIGFQISKPLLKKAFFKTYGIDIDDLFGNFEKAVGSFRWIVKDLLPELTRQAWKSNKKNIKKLSPNITRHRFVYRMRRPDYYGEFGKLREKNSVRATVISFFFRIFPKIGPLKHWKFKTPTPKAQLLFTESFDSSVLNYQNGLKRFESIHKIFANIDWDTGNKTIQYEYCLADKSYSDWLIRLKDENFDTITPSLKENILNFFKNYSSNGSVNEEQWQQTIRALEELKTKAFIESK